METRYKWCDIHPDAKIGDGVIIGSFTSIEEDVVIGEGTNISSNVVIMKGTRIGKNCKIFPGAVLGAIPQDLKYNNEETYLFIGDNNTIRECCTLNKGTIAAGETRIGHNNLLMAYVHVAHDCIIGDNNVIANSVNLAGHINIGNHVILGGMAAVQQFVRIGDHAMIGGGSLVRNDVPPFVKAAREPLSYAGTNTIGLERRGFANSDIQAIQDIYRLLYVKGKNINKAIESIENECPDTLYKSKILDFVKTAEKGLMRGYRQTSTEQ